MRKYRIWGGALLLVCLITGSIGYAHFKNTELVILEFGMFTRSNWGVASANTYVLIDKAVERFEKEHPNVKIHYYSGIAQEDYSEWCSQKLLAGKMPDVFVVLDSDFNLFCFLGIMKNLDGLMESDQEFDEGSFFSTALDIGKDSGSQYALPYETVPTLLFVNKSLLAKENIEMPKAGWTWEDMYDICTKVTKDLNGDGLLDQYGTYNYNWEHAAYTSGGYQVDEDNIPSLFTNGEVLDALKYMKRLNELNLGQSVTQEDFNQGNVAFMPLTFAEYRTYKTYPYRIKKYTSFQWDCITFPKGQEGENVSKVDALLVGINSKTKQEKLAWEFLKLLTFDEEMQMDIFRYSQGVSVLKEVAGSAEAAGLIQENMEDDEPVISSERLCQVIEQGMVEPKYSQYEQIMNLADNEISKILSEDKNIDSSMKIFQRSIVKYLQQHR